MSSLTIEPRSVGAFVRNSVPVPNRRSVWRRLFDRIIEARQRHAMEEIRRHRHLLPRELEDAGWKINERSEDSLPFVR